MFRWTDEMIRFQADAGRLTDFHRQLAAELLPYLSPEDHVCDAGCGLGFLSLALAPHVRAVTAAEQDDRALAVLREELAARGIGNVSTRCGDVFTALPAAFCDAMVFCFFGSMDEILSAAKGCCRGTVIAVKRDHAAHRFTVTKQPLGGTHGVDAACRRLEELGVPYSLKRTAFRFDQPFRTIADARRFFEIYRRTDDASLITDDFLRSRMEETGDTEFPWRLPSVRPLGIFVFHASSIPDVFPQEAHSEEKAGETRDKSDKSGGKQQ